MTMLVSPRCRYWLSLVMTRVTLQLHSAKVLIVMIIIFFMVVFLSFDAAKVH